MNKLERFLTACSGGVPDRPPVWIMRQAGRYLPEYRKLRKRYFFGQILSSPELSAMVTIQPLRRFGFDCAILFSDILVVAKIFGCRVRYGGGGVRISPSFADSAKIAKSPGGVEVLNVQRSTIVNLRKQLGEEFPIIGFAGSPFTVACYMVSGGTKDFNYTAMRKFIFGRMKRFKRLMDALTDAITESVIHQLEGSADAIMIFDSLGEIVSSRWLAELSIPYVRKVFDAVKSYNVPRIYYLRGGCLPPREVFKSGATVFSADYRLNLRELKGYLKGRMALQGNFDPAFLFSGEEFIRAEVRKMLSVTGGKGHVVNFGSGIFPATPLRAVSAFVDEVKRWKCEK